MLVAGITWNSVLPGAVGTMNDFSVPRTVSRVMYWRGSSTEMDSRSCITVAISFWKYKWVSVVLLWFYLWFYPDLVVLPVSTRWGGILIAKKLLKLDMSSHSGSKDDTPPSCHRKHSKSAPLELKWSGYQWQTWSFSFSCFSVSEDS